MRSQHRHFLFGLLFLFCIQGAFCGKYCLGQVGIAWDPSYASNCHHGSAGARRFGMNNLDNAGVCSALDVDVSDANDVQRNVLFEYYNANRFEVYSADGVSGWDTSCYLSALKQCRRRKQSWRNIDSHLGKTATGAVWVAPFAKRAYGMATGYQSPQWNAEQKPAASDLQVPSRDPLQAPNQVAPTLPTTASPLESPPDGLDLPKMDFSGDDFNSHGSIPEMNNAFPLTDPAESTAMPGEKSSSEEYEDAVGDLPPEFHWDESLLDELPELNGPAAGSIPQTQSVPDSFPMGNPLPPASGTLDRQGRVNQRMQNEVFVARQPQRGTRLESSKPETKTENALQAAIRMQSLKNDLR